MNSSIPKPLLGVVLVHPPKFDALLHLISSLSNHGLIQSLPSCAETLNSIEKAGSSADEAMG